MNIHKQSSSEHKIIFIAVEVVAQFRAEEEQ